MIKKRYLEKYITKDINQKMVFLGGARQVGKTTLLKDIIKNGNFKKELYLNWDNVDHKNNIIKQKFDTSPKIIFFDELHKMKDWKNYLKGIFDVYFPKIKIIISGSSRLNVYKKGGDSLMGRYYYYRLHPFSIAELLQLSPSKKFLESVDDLPELQFKDIKDGGATMRDLLQFGGFPEPLLKKDKTTWRRWQNNRMDKIVKEDIRDLNNISEISLMEILVRLLPEKIGSMLSINNIAQDLNINHKTAKKWLDILEDFYYQFRVHPHKSNLIKSLRKESKIFLNDWSLVKDEGAKFENLIGAHLLKFTHFLYDAYGHKAELKYLRDRSGREVDFLITVDDKPWVAVEVKLKKEAVSKNIFYFKNKLDIPHVFQVVLTEDIDFVQGDVRVMSASKFLTAFV